MIDHIILTVSNVERSLAFYEAALAPLNIKFFMPYKGANGHPDLWGFGDGKRAFFWLKHGAPDPQNIHWGFKADNDTAVDAFYKAAIAAGARDNISPRAAGVLSRLLRCRCLRPGWIFIRGCPQELTSALLVLKARRVHP